MIILICCTCLTTSLILIPDQPTIQARLNSWLLYSSDLRKLNVIELNINSLFGYLDKTDQDQNLKITSQSHILFYKAFSDNEWQGT